MPNKPLTSLKHHLKAPFKLELLILVLGLLLLLGLKHERLNLVIYNQVMASFNGVSPNHTVIVEIDDKSLAMLGEWPWDRKIHADLINVLEQQNVAAVGFDILFPAKQVNSPEQDTQFAEAIKRANMVVLPIAPSKSAVGGVPELFPQANLAQNAKTLGHVDFEIDIDGAIRKVYLYAGFQSSRWPSFALALASIVNPELKQTESQVTSGQGWIRRQPIYINYNPQVNQSGLDSVSYIDVLNGNIENGLLENKVVLVGMNATAMGDQFVTPISVNHQTMSGVEVNAHVVNNLLNQNYIKPLPLQLQVVTAVMMLLLTGLTLLWLNESRLIQAMIGLICFNVGLSTILLTQYQLWYPPILIIAMQILIFAIISLTRRTQLKQKVSTLSHELVHDPITNLPNTLGLKQYIEAHSSTIGTEQNELFLINLNVSRVKGIKNLLSESIAHELIEIITKRIQTCVPNSAYIAHETDANFYIALTSFPEVEALKQLTTTLIDTVGAAYQIGNDTFSLAVYIGVSRSYQTEQNYQEFIASAQLSVAKAQENKQSQVCFFNDQLKQEQEEKAKLESDLASAVTRHEIIIHYQPQISAKSGKIIGAEALVRWNHAERGLISPDKFIPIAESSGLIIDIGKWILTEACKQAKRWQACGNPNFRIAVNVSTIQFAQPDFVDTVKEVLEYTELAPCYLELEVTESGIIEDLQFAISTLTQLKNLGVTLSIDDFGTGYSSLSYLKHFPIDRIKIDRSFVSDIETDKEAQDITLAIIQMAHSLNMGVVAEGIETSSQKDFLSENHCEELQGFYFAKPISSGEIDSLLQAEKDMGLNK